MKSLLLSPPKKIWITSYILLIVTFLVYWLLANQLVLIEGIFFAYLVACLPHNWFLYKRYTLPFFTKIIMNRLHYWDQHFLSRFLLRFILHYVQIFAFVFLFSFALPICYILWLTEKQVHLNR